MPRRKRTSPSADETKPKKSRAAGAHAHTHGHSHSRRKWHVEPDSPFSTKRCLVWFSEYTGDVEDTMGPEGMEKFCEDIGVEPENIVMLCLAHKLEAKQLGYFTKAEWLKGMTELQCDSVERLQGKLDYLRSQLDDHAMFKSIYRYAFDFAKEKDQRSMEMETAGLMLRLLLGKHWSLFPSFHQYLEQSKYKVINKDQWCNVLEFSRLILPDLSNYDEDGAWPVMLDEFVEWYRDQHGISPPRVATSTADAMAL